MNLFNILLIIWLSGYILSFVLIIFYQYRDNGELTIGDFVASFCVSILSWISIFFVAWDLCEDSFADLMNVSVIRKKHNEKENQR